MVEPDQPPSLFAQERLLEGSKLTIKATAAGFGAIILALILGLTVGPVDLRFDRVLMELLDGIPGVSVDSGLSETHQAIVDKIRLPRVVLGLLVGATLSLSGAAYQGAFRNPLADPYLLGIAAGAGLGATIAITRELGDGAGLTDPVPLAAFAGALVAVGVSFLAGHLGGHSTVSLVLAGVAVASFLTACQTYVLQSNTDVIREVYSWILGRIATSGWSEPALMTPYFVLSAAVVLRYRRALDVLSVGDEEAASLGLNPRRIRSIVVIVSLARRSRRSVGHRADRICRNHCAAHCSVDIRSKSSCSAPVVDSVRRRLHGVGRSHCAHHSATGGTSDRRCHGVHRSTVLCDRAADQSTRGLVIRHQC